MAKPLLYAATVSNLTDARYFAAWGFEWMGFQMEVGAEGFIGPAQVKGMMEWVDGVQFVGEFGLQAPEQIQETVDLLTLHAIKLPHFAEADTVRALQGTPIFKEWVLSEPVDLALIQQQAEELAGLIAYCFLDFQKVGVPFTKIPLQELKHFCEAFPTILALDWSPENLPVTIDRVQPAGIVLKGGAEEKTGFKSFDDLEELIEIL